MPAHQPPDSGPVRLELVTKALWPVSISVAFGVLSAAVSVITGLRIIAWAYWLSGWVSWLT